MLHTAEIPITSINKYQYLINF